MKRLLYPIRYVFALLWTSFTEWLNDECLRYGASLSYYTVFSLAPLLVILVAVVGYFFGEGTTQQQLVQEASHLAGDKAGELVALILQSANQPSFSTWASVIALCIALAAATAVLVELQAALDRIWMLMPDTTRSRNFLYKLWNVLITRFWSLLVMLVIGFVIMGFTLTSAYVKVVEQWVHHQTAGRIPTAELTSPALTFIIMTTLFTIMLVGLPSKRLRWRAVLPGAATAALLFMLGNSLISSYISNAPMVSVYGAAGSLVAFMAWVYYSSQSLLFGAELAWVIVITPKGELPGSPAYKLAHFDARKARLHALAVTQGYVNQHTDTASHTENKPL